MSCQLTRIRRLYSSAHTRLSVIAPASPGGTSGANKIRGFTEHCKNQRILFGRDLSVSCARDVLSIQDLAANLEYWFQLPLDEQPLDRKLGAKCLADACEVAGPVPDCPPPRPSGIFCAAGSVFSLLERPEPFAQYLGTLNDAGVYIVRQAVGRHRCQGRIVRHLLGQGPLHRR